MVYLSPCSSHCWFKPCAWGHGSPLGLVSPAWRSVGPCARDLPSWSMAASGAWGPHRTSKTGVLPSFHLNVSCELVVGWSYNWKPRHLRGTEGEMEAEKAGACLCVKHHHQGCPPSAPQSPASPTTPPRSYCLLPMRTHALIAVTLGKLEIALRSQGETRTKNILIDTKYHIERLYWHIPHPEWG